MKDRRQENTSKNLNPLGRPLSLYVLGSLLLVYLLFLPCWAVTSKITRHSSSAELLKGKTRDVVIGSRGTVQLGRAAETLADEFEGVWSINSILVSAGTIFVGTSPNGGLYKYSLGELTKIYPLKSRDESTEPDIDEPNDANTVESEQHLINEHIFAMATDVAGRLLVGISGEKCSLCRLEADEIKTVFEPNDAKYIFAIAVDDAGNIYLGTGPEGKAYQLDSFAKNPELIYDSTDNNILSLTVGRDGFLYAGSDDRGLVYKIDPANKTATVLYDSDQPEITALLFADIENAVEDRQADLFAAATSAKITQVPPAMVPQLPFAGRPETPSQEQESAGEGDGGLKLQIANTKKQSEEDSAKAQMPPTKLPKPTEASLIYKITPDGYVTDVFDETAVFFCLAAQQNTLLVGTGNSGRLFTIELDSEREAVIYEDEYASQITAVAATGRDIYLGTANPAKLIKLTETFAPEGTYTSDLIDAGQPAKWGKLQIDADIPPGCNVRVASRSGNVKDVNDPTFSPWTDLVEVIEPIQLDCPLGRFCQYKLVLQSPDGEETPIVREIAVAGTVPNLAPKVESVLADRIETPDKRGFFKISYKARDDNDDKLIYKIDFRKLGRTNWIELKDQLEADTFEWDGRTVEDGRYEIKITASDERSNTTATKLTGTRISDPVVVDNTAPVIEKYSIEKSEKTITLKLHISDLLSAIGLLHYTVDSNAEWISAVPDDLVYDTTDEDFTVVVEDIEPGEHIIAVKIADDVGNTMYKTFEVEMAQSQD